LDERRVQDAIRPENIDAEELEAIPPELHPKHRRSHRKSVQLVPNYAENPSRRKQLETERRAESAALRAGDEVQVLYEADGQWYNAVISARRKTDMAFGIYFPASGDWSAWAEWVTLKAASNRLRKRCTSPRPEACGHDGGSLADRADSAMPLKMKYKLQQKIQLHARAGAKTLQGRSVRVGGVGGVGGLAIQRLSPPPGSKMRSRTGADRPQKEENPSRTTSRPDDNPSLPEDPAVEVEAKVFTSEADCPRCQGKHVAHTCNFRARNAATKTPAAAAGPPSKTPTSVRPEKNRVQPDAAAPSVNMERGADAAVDSPAADAAVGCAEMLGVLEAMGFDKAQCLEAVEQGGCRTAMTAVEYLSGDARRRKRTKH
jgi:hypothetical protein